jgi:hypothetical protein
MNRLIELNDKGILIIQPEALAIKAYADIWNRDKTKDHALSIKELTLVYFACSIDKYNPYKQFASGERLKRIQEDLSFPIGWKIDKLINDAIIQFKAHNYSYATEFVASSLKAAYKMREFYETVDINERDNNGKPIWKPVDINRALKETGSVIKSLKELEKIDFDENTAQGRIRGGGKKGAFEEFDKDITI